MGDHRGSGRSGSIGTALGVILVLLGILFLAGQMLEISLGRVGWPFFVIVPGLVIGAIALGVGGRAGEGLFVAGTIVTVTGLILLYQNATSHWTSWAYAWALIAPTSAGLGQMIYSLAGGNGERAGQGARVAAVGLGIFLVAGAFFELILDISGRGYGHLGGYVFPLLLIGLGVLLLFMNLVSGRGGTRPPARSQPAIPRSDEPPSAENDERGV